MERTGVYNTVQYAIQMPSFHLPDIYGSIRTANDHKVIQWPPFNSHNREKVSRGEHDAFSLRQ